MASGSGSGDPVRRFFDYVYRREPHTPEVESPSPSWFRRLEAYREDVVRRLLVPGGRLLDVGCGDGEFLFSVAGMFAELVGIDVSEKRIGRVRRRAGGLALRGARFEVVNVDAGLPFADESFDAIVCIATLCVLFDPFYFIQEANRVQAPGGLLVVQVPNLAFLPRRLELLLGRLPVTSASGPGEGWEGGVLHHFTFSSLGQLFSAGGYRVERRTGSGLLAGLRTWWPSLLSSDIVMLGRKVRAPDPALAPWVQGQAGGEAEG